MERSLSYRASQFFSLLLGTRISVVLFITFALYVSNFALINFDEDFKSLFFDFKIHGIILCSLLSISAGNIINQFYDQEKDKVLMPFTYRWKSFLKQKYFLYIYIILNALSLGIALFLSFRVFVFFLVYQFIIWFYSHKLSRMLFVNNITYVVLSVYPFLGLLIYYQKIDEMLLFMSLFLFVHMLCIDVIKDMITKEVDGPLNYETIPVTFGEKATRFCLVFLMIINVFSSYFVVLNMSDRPVNQIYFKLSIPFYLILMSYLILIKSSKVKWVSFLMKFWVLLGLLFMVANKIYFV